MTQQGSSPRDAAGPLDVASEHPLEHAAITPHRIPPARMGTIGVVAQEMCAPRNDQLHTTPQVFQRLLGIPMGLPETIADQALKEAHTEIMQVCADYLPRELQRQLIPRGLAEMPTQIGSFIPWILERASRARDVAFARQVFSLAQIIQGLNELGWSYEEREFIRIAALKALHPCFETDEQHLPLHYARNRNGHERCIAAGFDPAIVAAHPHAISESFPDVPMRAVQLADRVVPVGVFIRVKRPFSIYLRMLRERTLNAMRIPDPFGFRFVCCSSHDRRAFEQHLYDRLPVIERTRTQYLDRYGHTNERRPNQYSARNFRVTMWCADIAGARWEFQLMDAPDFVNLWCSKGSENWYLYRLRQLIALFFRHCFPKEHTGVDWKHAARLCQQHLLKVRRGHING
ncbi:MAG: hypothetical protein Q7S96_02635 [bacterium]|nr:hypothetical protein [bacterium]